MSLILNICNILPDKTILVQRNSNASNWQHFTFTILTFTKYSDRTLFGQANFLSWSDRDSFGQASFSWPLLALRLPQRLNCNPWATAEWVKKTDFLSKCGRIYTWSLLQILSSPLYFRCFNWLFLVESSSDWSIWWASGTFGALFISGFLPGELQFVLLLRISCHVHFLVVFVH